MLLLAGAGVAAYFCWPRGIPPKVSIVATEVSGASAINAVAPYSIHVPVTIRINVTSEMKIGIPLDSIVAEGSYTPASTGQPVKIAGGVLRDPYFAPESTTTLDIPFDVAYNSSDLGDPLINSLLEDCNIGTSGGKGTITIRWQATVVARLFTFVRVTTSGTEDVECPTASISASLVATTKSILGELGVDPNEVPDDASQLLPYLLQKAESLGIELPPNTNILQLATEVAKALGYDLNEVLKNGANIIGRFFGSRR